MPKAQPGWVMVWVFALLAAGCSSYSSAPVGSGGAASAVAPPPGPGSRHQATYLLGIGVSGKVTTATITDPALNNMVALTTTIPEGWELQGMVQTSPCVNRPWPVSRVYSPDGLMQVISEPLLGWRWESDGSAPGEPNHGCAQIQQRISASDFLEYYIGTIQGGVHRAGTAAVPASFQQDTQALVDQANQMIRRVQGSHPGFGVSGDNAGQRIETVDGSFVLDEQVVAGVICTLSLIPATRQANTCWGRLAVVTAPQGRLDALLQALQSNHLPRSTVNPEYQQQKIALARRKTRRALDTEAEIAARNSAVLYNQFQQSMHRLQSEHQQWMQQQESQFESARANPNAQTNSQGTATSDWVDDALDQQTVAGPNGVPSKASNAYTQTWTNGAQWYQTNDPNSNPNGVLEGNWTLTTQVRGNGEPK